MSDTIKLNPEYTIDITDFNTKEYARIDFDGTIHLNVNDEMIKLQDIIDAMTELRDFMLENMPPQKRCPYQSLTRTPLALFCEKIENASGQCMGNPDNCVHLQGLKEA